MAVSLMPHLGTGTRLTSKQLADLSADTSLRLQYLELLPFVAANSEPTCGDAEESSESPPVKCPLHQQRHGLFAVVANDGFPPFVSNAAHAKYGPSSVSKE